jgi:23S rRNA (uracil1939-C5)-methyltransferase
MHTITCEIKKLSHDGRGIAQIDGKTIFVFGALPGEQVAIDYITKRSKFDEAKAYEIINASPERALPQCQFFGLCGGCTLQHMHQDAQISFKHNVLLEQLWHFGKVKPLNILAPLRSAPYGYRRKARYSVRYIAKKDRVFVGFRELHQPRFLADINSCEVLDPHLARLLKPLQDLLYELDCKKSIAQIEAARGDNATALIIRHMERLTPADHDLLVTFAQKYNIWLFLQPGNYNSIHKIFPQDANNFLEYNIANNIILYFHPADFTQINYNINKQMIAQALYYLDLQSHDKILDLFCGVGNFSLPLAQGCERVIGIEGEALMIERAFMNAKRNELHNASFYHADLNNLEKIPTILSDFSYNKVLIDPPRSGARAVVEGLDLSSVQTLVYISCNPATLARDAGILAQRGLVLTHAGVMDMFSHTEHVEAMAVFKSERLL